MAEKVFLEVELDEKDTIQKAADLSRAIDELKAKQKELDKSTEDGRREYVALDAQIKSVQKQYNSFKSILEANNTAVAANTGSYEQLLAQLRAAEIELKKQGDLLSAEADGTVKFSQAYFDASEKVDKLKQGVLLFNAGIMQGNMNVGNYGNTLDAMRARLGQLEKAYAVLNKEVDGEVFFKVEAAITETSESIRQMEFELNKAKGLVNEFGEREPRNPAKKAFDDALTSANALANGIALLNVLQSDNENVAELQAKALKTLVIVETTANIVRSKGEIIDTAANIQKAIYNKLVVAQTFVTQGATVATQALRAAMLTLGIGALIGLIYGLVKAFQFLTKGTKDQSVSFGDAALSAEEYNKVMAESAKAVQEQTTKINAFLQVAKDESKTYAQRNAAVKELNKLIPELNGHISVQNINTEKVNKAIEEHIRQIELQAKADALYNVIVERQEKFVNARLKAEAELNKELKKSEKSASRIDDANLQTEIYNKNLQKKAEFDQMAADKTKKHDEAMKGLEAEYQNLIAQVIAGKSTITDAFGDPEAALRDKKAALNLELMAVKDNIEKQIDLNLQLIDVETAIKLQKEGLTKNEIALIKAQAAEEKKYFEDRKKNLHDAGLTPIDFGIPKPEEIKTTSQASLAEVGGYYDKVRNLQIQSAAANTQAERDKLIMLADSLKAQIKLDTTLTEAKKAELTKQLDDFQKYLDGLNDADAKAADERMQKLNEYISFAGNAFGRLGAIFRQSLDNELIALDNQLAQKKISQAQYDKEVKQARTQAARQHKAVALFQSVIDGASAVVESLPNIPLSVIIGLLAAAQTSFIASQPIPTFAQGGKIPRAEDGLRIRIGGKDHSQGGTKFYGEDGTRFEAQRGEDLFVLKREAAGYIDMLSSINQLHGGRPFSAGPATYMEDGGFVARAGGFGSFQDAEQIVAAMMRNFPDIFVSVKEMRSVERAADNAKRVTVVE